MDKYTKAVLTVIAACLVVQTAKDIAFVKPAYANQVHRVAICTADGSSCVGVTEQDGGLARRYGGGRFRLENY